MTQSTMYDPNPYFAAPPGPPVPPPAPPRPGRRPWWAIVVVLVALLVGPAVIGYEVGNSQNSSTPAARSAPATTFGAPSGSARTPSTGSTGSTATLDVATIADRTDDSVVNITTTLSSGGQAAATGILISTSGLVLTNNHVIADSTRLDVELASTGKVYSGKVLGYDVVDDVALVQLQNASGLRAALLGTSSSLALGDPIVALGNAGGRGGDPSVVSGRVTGLDEQITASDADGSNVQTLSDLIQVDANIQSGDSGGPLVNGRAEVVGMNAAASSRNGRFTFGGLGANEGYAIPIENALAIAKKITSGEGGPDVHIGANRAILGVQIQSELASGLGSRGGTGSRTGGAAVLGVESGSGADRAGVGAGDTITGIGNKSVTSATDLTRALTPYSPGDTVEITWRDASGATHHASVKLGSGPPA